MDVQKEVSVGQNAFAGCLVGTAVGDALGLPAEGLSPARQKRLFGGPITRHRLVLGKGMVSDDTEHAVFALQALVASAGDPARFEKAIARQLKTWILLLPAGVGWATLRACSRLLVGVPPSRSGVFSAGNGPAMRSAPLGVWCAMDTSPSLLRALVRANTRITHTDPKAEYAALAVAVAAGCAVRGKINGRAFLAAFAHALGDDVDVCRPVLDLLTQTVESAERGESTVRFAADGLGLGRKGASGYCYHTVPVALHAVLRYPRDFRGAVEAVIACGGDTDTTAAITGGIIGAGVGADAIPAEWMGDLCDRPRTIAWLTHLAERAAAAAAHTKTPQKMITVFFPALCLRNIFFLLVVLWHGFRRLLPPF